MIFAFLTKIPLTSIIVVSASVISLILSSVSHDVISIKKVRIKLCILILFLFILLIRILANLALFDNLSQSDLDYIITISLAMVIYITFLVRPNPVALKYGILSAVIFTIVLALIEYILHVNTGSSRFEDPTNMFYLSDNRVPTAFYYNENERLWANKVTYNPYSLRKMFFQQITRSINKLEIVVIENIELYRKIVSIFE